jgi:rod shape determining protein RodA
MRWREVDWLLLLMMLALLAFGIINVASTAYVAAEQRYQGYLLRQCCYAVLGLGIFACMHWISYQRLERLAYLLYWVGLLLLICVFFMPANRGSRRWITLGPVPFQPSEPMKLLLVIALARILKHQRTTTRLTDLFPALALTAVPMLLIARQPDLGSALTLVPIACSMLYVAGARTQHLGQLALVGLMLMPFGVLLLKPYQLERIRTYLAQGELTRQQQLDQAYQSIQAEIAVGSGGVFGKGWRQGTQNVYGFVPDRHNDFIFAILAEEWGLLGATLTLGGFLVLVCSLLGTVTAVREPFGQLIATGVAAIVATHVIVHVAINTQLFPVTGLTLPLISSGGTALIVTLVALAIASNVRVWAPPSL